jgi:hypothetical protein
MQRRIPLSVRPSARRFSTYSRDSPSWIIPTIATMCNALFRDLSPPRFNRCRTVFLLTRPLFSGGVPIGRYVTQQKVDAEVVSVNLTMYLAASGCHSLTELHQRLGHAGSHSFFDGGYVSLCTQAEEVQHQWFVPNLACRFSFIVGPLQAGHAGPGRNT